MPNRGDKIFVLVAKNLKLQVFMFKSVEHFSKSSDTRHVDSRTVLAHYHQWKLEQKKIDDLKVPKVDRNN